ncbi:MAG TPA: hypothetical protein VFH39_01365 [Candidatus Saccharimonadales bacterium]|nr:hypothetical protein [Candidatus Saccharimonadales bacterium]
MLAIKFLTWWYTAGWRDAGRRVNRQLSSVSDAFSVGILLRTLFAPWRRIISYPGAGIDAHIHAALDNAVSRFIGFLVRMMALIAASVMLLVSMIGGAVVLLLWPLLPLLALGLIAWGLA